MWCRWTLTERGGWGTSTLRAPRTPTSSLDPSKTTRQQHINKYSGYIESWLHFSALLSCYLVLNHDQRILYVTELLICFSFVVFSEKDEGKRKESPSQNRAVVRKWNASTGGLGQIPNKPAGGLNSYIRFNQKLMYKIFDWGLEVLSRWIVLWWEGHNHRVWFLNECLPCVVYNIIGFSDCVNDNIRYI